MAVTSRRSAGDPVGITVRANPRGERFGGFRLYYLSGAGLVYSLVNIPYGSLNASLTRDPESIDKLTSTRMMLANSANLLVYTLFPMFVQMAAPKDRSLKDTGFLALS